MLLNSRASRAKEKISWWLFGQNAKRKVFYFLLLFLPGCYVIAFSETIASFQFENDTRVIRVNFVARDYLVPGGRMFFVFLFPGYACEKPMEDAYIYIKVRSENKLLLTEARNLRDLVFARPGTGPQCYPLAAFYEKAAGNPMSFDLKGMYEKLVIEIYCECEKIESMHVWLKDISAIGSKKMWERVKDIEKKWL